MISLGDELTSMGSNLARQLQLPSCRHSLGKAGPLVSRDLASYSDWPTGREEDDRLVDKKGKDGGLLWIQVASSKQNERDFETQSVSGDVRCRNG
jgi:hypothetical protein